MSKPIFTKVQIIPDELNFNTDYLRSLSDEKFKEYVEKLRLHFISLHKNGHPVFSTNKTEEEIIHNFKDFLNHYNDNETLKLSNTINQPSNLFDVDKMGEFDTILDRMLFYNTRNSNAINHWFPEIWDTKISTGKAVTDQFFDKKNFFKNVHAVLIKDRFKLHRDGNGTYKVDKFLITCLRIVNGNQPVYNFPSTLARWIYFKRAKEVLRGSRKTFNILDMSMGWAGRLLGALGAETLVNAGRFSDELIKFNYFGTDVNTIVHERFKMFMDFWRENIRESNITVYKSIVPAENIFNDKIFQKVKGKFDIMFTSPPYFNKEMYSDDTNQSYLTYNNEYKLWKNGFLRGMLQNTYDLLGTGGEAWINIADVKYKSSKYHPLEKDTVEIGEEIGFKYIDKYYMVFGIMPGLDKRSKAEKEFKESVYNIKETVNKNTKGNNPITKNTIEYNGKKYKYEPIFVLKK